MRRGTVGLVRSRSGKFPQGKKRTRPARASSAACVEAAPIAIFVVDTQGRFLEANPAGLSLLGVDLSTLRSGTFLDLLQPTNRSVAIQELEALEQGGAVDREFQLNRPDGRRFWTHLRAVRLGAGRYVGFCQDVTQRKDAERALGEREVRLRAYFETPAVGVAVTSPEKGWMEVNDQLCAMLGYPRAELSRMTWSELTHPDDIASDVAQFDRVVAGEIDGYSLDKRFIRKDGSVLWALLSVSCVRRSDGSIDYFVAVLTDIGKRKAEETLLGESEALFRAQFEAHAAVKLMIDPGTGRILDANPAAVAFYGWPRERLREMRIQDINTLSPDEVETEMARARCRQTTHFDFRHRCADGSVRDVEVYSSQIRVKERTVLHSIIHDVSDRRRAEQALRESEERYRSLVENLQAGVVVHAPDSSIILGNARASELLGLSADQMRGKAAVDPAWRFVHEDGAAMQIAEYPVSRVIASGAPILNQMLGIDRPGTGDRAWVLVNAYPSFHAPGGLQQVVVTFVEITERKVAEAALRRSEARFRALSDGAPVGIFETDAQGRNVYLNRAGGEILGMSPEAARGTGWQVAVHPEDRERVAREWGEAVVRGEVFAGRFRYLRPDGSVVQAQGYGAAIQDAEGNVTGFMGAVVDVTKQQELEQQLALSARLAAMGTLVAGLAHEINNPLAVEISGQGIALEIAHDLRSQLQKGAPLDPGAAVRELDEAIEALVDAQEGGRRAALIVKDMATFARPEGRRTRVRLIDAVREAMGWLSAQVAQGARIQIEDRGAPDVLGSAGQISQVVVNLVTNAVMAARAGGQGRVVVRTGRGEAGRAILEVEDDGVGIAPELLHRIFEPFFTTRPSGEARGTGLGLAICHAIATAHGGTISVDSEVGKGSTFRVELPAAPAGA